MLTDFKRKIDQDQHMTMLALGSSNTQRFQTGMHWFDYVELAFKLKCKWHSFINAGVSGNTSTELLERFDKNVACHRPDVVIITVGGNDSFPKRNVPPELFTQNLESLWKKITDLGGMVIFQTYYACDYEQMEADEPGSCGRLLHYMDIIRNTAKKLECPLVDHYRRWERLRLHDLTCYRTMMRDRMHVNALGNMVIGLDLVQFLGLDVWRDEDKHYCREGLIMTSYLDKLAAIETEN